MIYLDYSATAPLRPEAKAAMEPYWTKRYGNPSSIHGMGQEALAAINAAREQVGRCVGAGSSQVIFTGSGTEAVVTAILSAARGAPSGSHILLSSIEHNAALEAGELCRDLGYHVTTIPCDATGRITADALAGELRENTVLVSVLHANNETGVLQPVETLGSLCREAGVAFHVDAAQTAGKIPVDMARMGCDWISLSAHKLGGPKGVGALAGTRHRAIRPYLPGHQEYGMRGGTHNVPGIVGFGAAAEAGRHFQDLAPRQRFLETRLQHRLPEVRITGSSAPRLSNITHLTFPGLRKRDLVMALDMAGFCVSSGSACASGSEQPSHVLLAMGYAEEEAATAVRVSYSPQTTEEELSSFVEALESILGIRSGSAS